MASAAVKTESALTIPANATGAEVQADSQNVRYTMDNATDPTSTLGMIFVAAADPKVFTIDDIRRIRFVRAGGSDGRLNFHFFSGRDV